ncbi:MAG: putative toxin-antitoxin system toxin component, PIN family [Saprospiraceae bacterium]
MRVVLDTNIWVSSLSRRSEFNWVFQAFLDEAYTLVVSHEILLEYEEILNIKYGEASVAVFFNLMDEAKNVEFVEPHFFWNLLSDPDDNKFVDAAIAAGADYLVSEDRDFRSLQSVEFPEVTVLRMHEFEQLLKNT